MSTDNFNRADGGLGANWTTITSETDLAIVSNQVVASNGANDCSARYNAVSFANDQYSQLTLPTVGTGGGGLGAGLGVLVRGASGAQTYYRVVAHTSGTELGKVVAGTFTSLKTDATAWTDGDIIRLEVTGQNPNITLTVKRNGVTIGALTHTGETSINSGSAGISYSSSTANTAAGDDWDGGDLAGNSSSVSPSVSPSVSSSVSRSPSPSSSVSSSASASLSPSNSQSPSSSVSPSPGSILVMERTVFTYVD